MEQDEWLGDDHSISHPKLTRRELSMIHREGYSYNPLVLNQKDDYLEFAVRSELSFIASRFGDRGINEAVFPKIMKNAKRVRADIPLKVAVALYALGLYDPETLSEYMRLKGKEIRPWDLFHLAYRYRLKKLRKRVTFDEIISQSVEASVIPRSQLGRARTLFERFYEELSKDPELIGRKPSTIAKLALKRAMQEMGYSG